PPITSRLDARALSTPRGPGRLAGALRPLRRSAARSLPTWIDGKTVGKLLDRLQSVGLDCRSVGTPMEVPRRTRPADRRRDPFSAADRAFRGSVWSRHR